MEKARVDSFKEHEIFKRVVDTVWKCALIMLVWETIQSARDSRVESMIKGSL